MGGVDCFQVRGKNRDPGPMCKQHTAVVRYSYLYLPLFCQLYPWFVMLSSPFYPVGSTMKSRRQKHQKAAEDSSSSSSSSRERERESSAELQTCLLLLLLPIMIKVDTWTGSTDNITPHNFLPFFYYLFLFLKGKQRDTESFVYRFNIFWMHLY